MIKNINKRTLIIATAIAVPVLALGMMERTAKGRCVTERGANYWPVSKAWREKEVWK